MIQCFNYWVISATNFGKNIYDLYKTNKLNSKSIELTEFNTWLVLTELKDACKIFLFYVFQISNATGVSIDCVHSLW